MKIAFVTKVKEKDIKKLFPWAKQIALGMARYRGELPPLRLRRRKNHG